MPRVFQHFGWFHLWTFVACYVLFAVMTLAALRAETPSDQAANWMVLGPLGAVTGPFTGGISRGMQACCVRCGVTLLIYCVPVLGAGVAMQFVPLPFQRFSTTLRRTAWCVGLLGWFAGVPLSLGHALS